MFLNFIAEIRGWIGKCACGILWNKVVITYPNFKAVHLLARTPLKLEQGWVIALRVLTYPWPNRKAGLHHLCSTGRPLPINWLIWQNLLLSTKRSPSNTGTIVHVYTSLLHTEACILPKRFNYISLSHIFYKQRPYWAAQDTPSDSARCRRVWLFGRLKSKAGKSSPSLSNLDSLMGAVHTPGLPAGQL